MKRKYLEQATLLINKLFYIETCYVVLHNY